MGVDLDLLVCEPASEHPDEFPNSFALFDIGRDYTLQRMIREAAERHGEQVPENFINHVDETANDDYGRMWWVPVEYLITPEIAGQARKDLGKGNGPGNVPVWAYLLFLPPGWRIALYWST